MGRVSGYAFKPSRGSIWFVTRRATPRPTREVMGLAIPPHGPIGRVVQLTGIDRYVPVYPTLQLASDGEPPPAR